MAETYILAGYIDCPGEYGVPRPFYEKDQEFFFPRIDKELFKIKSFDLFEISSFKKSEIIPITEEIKKRVIGDNPIIIYKSPGGIIFGSKDDLKFVEKVRDIYISLPKERGREIKSTLKKVIS